MVVELDHPLPSWPWSCDATGARLIFLVQEFVTQWSAHPRELRTLGISQDMAAGKHLRQSWKQFSCFGEDLVGLAAPPAALLLEHVCTFPQQPVATDGFVGVLC